MVVGGHQHSLATLLELASAVESAGARALILDGDSAFRPSLPDAPMVDSWTATCAALHATETLEVGSLRLVTHWNALSLAKAVASLASLYPGRMRFSLGIGEQHAEARAGFPAPEVGERVSWLEEVVRVLPKLWTGELVDFRGRYVQIEGVRFAAIDSTPPIEIAARSPRMLALVARSAARVDLNLPPVARLVRLATEQLGRACQRAGRDPALIERSMWVATYVGERVSPDLFTRYRRSRPWFPMLRDDEISEAVVAGSAEACLDRLDEIRETLAIKCPMIDLCGFSRDACLHALDLLESAC